MTVNEFKAWLEGFEAAMGGNPPSAEQWAAIKAKLEKVSDRPTVTLREDRPRHWMSAQMADGAIDPLR